MEAFDLQRAIAGDPICDTTGTPVKFIAYVPEARQPLAILCRGRIFAYCAGGKIFDESESAQLDLRMATDPRDRLKALLEDPFYAEDTLDGRVNAIMATLGR